MKILFFSRQKNANRILVRSEDYVTKMFSAVAHAMVTINTKAYFAAASVMKPVFNKYCYIQYRV